MSVSFDFTGKVILITGSSSGIGARTAILFAKAGAKVVVTGRNADKVHSVAKECSDVSPNEVKALEVVADVSEEVDCRRLIETTINVFRKLDVLVNNAGFCLFSQISDPEYICRYKSVLATNLNAVVYLTHISVEHLAKTNGNIVNISSIGAIVATEDVSTYCMSKCAQDIFTKCMATELGPMGIRVNCVNPGGVRTNIFEASGLSKSESDAIFDHHAKIYPIGRAGNVDDIAYTIMYLASEQASFVSGTNLLADGGYYANGANFNTEKWIDTNKEDFIIRLNDNRGEKI